MTPAQQRAVAAISMIGSGALVCGIAGWSQLATYALDVIIACMSAVIVGA